MEQGTTTFQVNIVDGIPSITLLTGHIFTLKVELVQRLSSCFPTQELVENCFTFLQVTIVDLIYLPF